MVYIVYTLCLYNKYRLGTIKKTGEVTLPGARKMSEQYFGRKIFYPKNIHWEKYFVRTIFDTKNIMPEAYFSRKILSSKIIKQKIFHPNRILSEKYFIRIVFYPKNILSEPYAEHSLWLQWRIHEGVWVFPPP